MHLVLLGVMKRMINKIWRGKLPLCFSAQQIKIVNYDIEKCKHRLPREFQRKGQPLDKASNWKATFLLYTGPIVLKAGLNEEKYVHFLNIRTNHHWMFAVP